MPVAIFNAPDGTTLSNYSEDGMTFTFAEGATARISPSQRVIADAFSLYFISNNPLSDGRVIGDFIYRGGTADHGIIFRRNGTSGWFYLARFNSNQVQLFSWISGAFSLITSASYPITSGETYRLEARFSGANITISVNGIVVITTTNTAVTGTGQGFRIALGSTSTGMQMSRFEIAGLLSLGTISQSSLNENNISLTSTSPTPNNASIQWYRSSELPLVPSSNNLLAGQTGLTLTDTTANPGTLYFYKLVATLNSISIASAPVTGYRLPLFKIGFIGDSITAGYNTVSSAVAILEKLKYLKKIISQNSAIAGSRSDQWIAGSNNLNNALSAFSSALGTPSTNNPVYVSIMLGVNDSRVTRPTAQQYRTNMTSLLSTLTSAGYKIILHAPPYITIPQSATGEANNGYDTEAGMALLMEYSEIIKNDLVDNRDIFLGAENITEYFAVNSDEFLTTDIGSNGIPTLVHPNTAGVASYSQLWASAIYRAILADKVGGGAWGTFGDSTL